MTSCDEHERPTGWLRVVVGVAAVAVWPARTEAATTTAATLSEAPAATAGATASSTATPATAATFPGVRFNFGPGIERNDAGRPTWAVASFAGPEGIRIDIYRSDVLVRAPTLDFLDTWVDGRLPGDTLVGGLREHGGGLRAHTVRGRGLFLVPTAKGPYLAVVAPGRTLDTAIVSAEVLSPVPPPPTAAPVTAGGVRLKLPPGFEPMPPDKAPSWAEVALWVPSLRATPPQIWVHTAEYVDIETARDAAERILRDGLRVAGLTAALKHAPAETLPVETIGGWTAVILRTRTLNFDIAAVYTSPQPGLGLLAVLLTPNHQLARYEGALRGLLSTATLPGGGSEAGAPATTAFGATADPEAPSSRRAWMALVLVLGLILAAGLTWVYVRRMRGS